MYTTRLQTIRQIARAARLDAIALVPGANMTYLTGQSFHLMERPTIAFFPVTGDPVFVLPRLEQDKLADPPYPVRLFTYTDDTGPNGAFKAALDTLKLDDRWLGVEGLRMRFNEVRMITRHASGIEITDATAALAALRLKKDASELAAMRQAIAISEAALREVVDSVQPGTSERALANALQIAMLQRGGEALPFDPIVLSGPRSALPHGTPGERAVQAGELLLFDFGTTSGGYASDITRTFAVGALRDQRLLDAYQAVYAANEAGRRAAGPGVPCQEVDRAARAAIVNAGFGEYFTHRTGHGLGMEGHEGPYIREGNTERLEVGHVFTVEPGIYLPGVGGIRIEDDVVITENGAESLTTFPRELQTIGE
ncbi:MAG: aminopeptidase P family protein [Anaerolineae bacterium]